MRSSGWRRVDIGRHDETVLFTLRKRSSPQLTAPLITGLSITPPSTPQLVAICLYAPVCIKCSSAFSNGCARGEPLATGQPYGSESNTSPACSSLPLLCLMAYCVTGESADIASSWPSNGRTLRAGLPASVHFLLRAGSSSVSWVPAACTATFLPHAFSGSICSPGRRAHAEPAEK